MGREPQLRMEASRTGREPRTNAHAQLTSGVLIVVTERLAGRRLARMLTRRGFDGVRAVSDVARALVLAHEYAPGIIFLDLTLSDDAYELARALGHQSGMDGHRLIALTPAIDHTTRERARRAGFERWLVTPVVQSELDDLLHMHQSLLAE